MASTTINKLAGNFESLRGLRQWLSQSLTRKFVAGTALGLLTTSIVFMALFLWLYRGQLENERSQASLEVNRLLQASLENAMLKRDLDGLRTIVQRLGTQTGITNVMITDPHYEVRFASTASMIGRQINGGEDTLCTTCSDDDEPERQFTAFVKNEHGDDVLRSVNAVQNKPACVECHGPVETNPINGVLFVDYDAKPITQQARTTAWLFASAGILVVLTTLGGGTWFMRRQVLMPVRALCDTSREYGAGNLDTRVKPDGSDELAILGKEFDRMAARLQNTLNEVREKENFSQALIDANPDGIRVVDDQFNILMSNKTYRNQLGREIQDDLGLPCYASSHGRTEPCPPTMITCPIHEMRSHGKPLKAVHRHVRTDGKEVPVEVFAAPMNVSVDGQPRSLVVESIRDLSQTIEYSHEQKLSTVGELATGVAHEIHNPLASVKLALRSIRDEKDSRRLNDYLILVDEQVDRCIDVTERLLKLSRFSGGQPNVIEINSAVRETLSLLHYEASDLNVTVDLVLDDSEPRVIACDSDIRMAILNLAQNAFHAMPQGGRLRIETSICSNVITIGFQDTGIGISTEDHQRIFDPFYSKRADGVRGIGLGLSIVKAIVDRYDGQIDVQSRVGHGATFNMTFPNPDYQTAHTQQTAVYD